MVRLAALAVAALLGAAEAGAVDLLEAASSRRSATEAAAGAEPTRVVRSSRVILASRVVEDDGLPLKTLPAPTQRDPADAGAERTATSRRQLSPNPTAPGDQDDQTATGDGGETERPRGRGADAGRDDDRRASRVRGRDGEARRNARKDPCTESAKACADALRFLREDDIASIDLDIRVGGKPGNDYPCECRLEGETFEPRRFASTTMTWKAAGYCHKPLYFEDWELERYGHSRGMFLDPFIAGAHFFVTLPILPYKAGMQAPWECVYPLGYYRPGSCAPWTVPAVPYSARGFAVQGATVTGLVFLLP